MIAIDSDRGIIRYEERLIKISGFFINMTDGDVRDAEVLSGIRDFLNELRIIKKKQESYRARFLDIQSRDALLDRSRHAKKRLFLLDYDGTLIPSFNLPSLASPDNLLLDILN